MNDNAGLPPFSLNGFNGSPYVGRVEDLPGWIDAAAAAGFAQLGPDMMSLAAWEARGKSLAELARLFRDAGIGCGTIAAAGMFDGGDHALPTLLKAAEAGEALDAQFLQINMAGPDPAARRAMLEQACEVIDGRGFRLAIEYMPHVGLSTVSETVALAHHVGTARAGAMIDIWHHTRGPDTWDDLEAVPLDAIAYIEMDDAFPAQSDDVSAETLHRRTFCGEGEFDVARFVQVFRDKGYAGMVSVEVLNEEWRSRPVAEFARRCFESTARYWG